MKPGLQKNSGHYMEMRKHPGKKWGDKYGGFFYCTLCDQYAWGWQVICPKRQIQVPIMVKVQV